MAGSGRGVIVPSPDHIARISRSRYVLATPSCLDWQRGLPRANTRLSSCDAPPRHRNVPTADRDGLTSWGISGSPSTAASRTRRTFQRVVAAFRGRAHDDKRRRVGTSVVSVPGNRCISVGHKSEISGPELRALKEAGVEYISTRSIGFDHIDLDAAETWGSPSKTWCTRRTALPTTP